MAEDIAKLIRPIVGIENRTPQEAFDIMADRIRSHFKTDSVPADVRRLVIAARNMAFGNFGSEEIMELDAASEAFASRVPWDDEPARSTETGEDVR